MSDSTQFERISKQDIKHSVRGPSINMYSCLQHEDTAVQYILGGIISIIVDTTFISDSHIFFLSKVWHIIKTSTNYHSNKNNINNKT